MFSDAMSCDGRHCATWQKHIFYDLFCMQWCLHCMPPPVLVALATTWHRLQELSWLYNANVSWVASQRCSQAIEGRYLWINGMQGSADAWGNVESLACVRPSWWSAEEGNIIRLRCSIRAQRFVGFCGYRETRGPFPEKMKRFAKRHKTRWDP